MRFLVFDRSDGAWDRFIDPAHWGIQDPFAPDIAGAGNHNRVLVAGLQVVLAERAYCDAGLGKHSAQIQERFGRLPLPDVVPDVADIDQHAAVEVSSAIRLETQVQERPRGLGRVANFRVVAVIVTEYSE